MSSDQISPQPTGSSSTSPRTSLLDLPYEIRANILRYVLKAQPFLSSRQQLSAIGPERLHRPKHEGETVKEEQQSRPPRAHQKISPSPFTSPSITFKQYAESRHADTSILYTCRQLRSEGLPLWYQYKYYLTLVLEVPHLPLPLSLSPSTSSTYTSFPPHSGINPLTSTIPALHYNPTSASSIRDFWTQIRDELRFPTMSAVRKFKTFHVSLYLEDVALSELLEGYDGVEDLDVRLTKEEILEILLGVGRDGATGVEREKEDGIEGEDTMREFENVKFEDHTFLELVRGSEEIVRPGRRRVEIVGEGRGGEGIEEEIEARISFSVELWRV